ncbi:hypothetical protein [Telmatospirillum sp. J64-1]|uniref:hypothetical protein n=1 Tax=Telmatospirillum sp. J64-1 TaxID=2502183 RepID=UPI00115C9CC9|nr:hypothetical protein [Telmatospirillum sp. J64-1]
MVHDKREELSLGSGSLADITADACQREAASAAYHSAVALALSAAGEAEGAAVLNAIADHERATVRELSVGRAILRPRPVVSVRDLRALDQTELLRRVEARLDLAINHYLEVASRAADPAAACEARALAQEKVEALGRVRKLLRSMVGRRFA